MALVLALGAGCAQSGGSSDGGGTGGTGGLGGQGGSAQGSGGSGGAVATDCAPGCGAGKVCVGSGVEGGVLVIPNDAGVCPAGYHVSGNFCQHDLSYACQPMPAACNGTLTCACATSICSNPICQVVSPTELTCIQAVP